MNRSCLEKFLVVASLIACIGWRVPAQAQDKQLRKISWGVTSLSASNWIPWIAKEAKIGKTLTPRFMRRTFQDLGRAASVHDFVSMSRI